MFVSTSRKPRVGAGFMTGRTALCLLIGSLAATSQTLGQASQGSVAPAVVVSALRSRVLISGLESPEPEVLRIQDADSLIAALGDPYARLLSPPAYQRFRSATGVAYGGIGARISTREDTVWVTIVYPGSPAEVSGLRPLDRVVAINEHNTVGWSTGMAVEELRGPIGSTLTLLVIRGQGQKPIAFTVRRGRIRIPSVQAAMVDSFGVGIVHLAQFGEGAAHSLRLALDSLVEAGMTGLILDLRGNAGGLLSEALDVARLFLHEEQLITEVRGRPGTVPIRFVDRTPDAYPNLPVIVLAGPNTASASEIVAGALQDHGRAAVLGTRSYGKGSVQQVFALPRRWRIKLTTARWYRPSGQTLDRLVLRAGDSTTLVLPGGITPDLVMADSMRLRAHRIVQGFSDHWPKVSSALLGEVSRYLDSASTVSPDLVIRPSALTGMLDTLLSRVGALPPSLDRVEVRGWLAQRLAHLVVGVRWGQAAGTRWRYARDVQIAAASARLRQAHTPTALVALVRWSTASQVAQASGAHPIAFPALHHKPY